MSQNQKKPTRRQQILAAINDASSLIPLSKNTRTSLASVYAKTDDANVASLLSLLSQPDPHASLSGYLPIKVRDARASWLDTTEDDLIQWVNNADIAFHVVDAYARSQGFVDFPTDSFYTARFIEGMAHYPALPSEQLIDLALIATAAHSAIIRHESDRNRKEETYPDILQNHDLALPHNHTWCAGVGSQAIIDLVTSSHVTAEKMLRLITDGEHLYSEERILYVMDDNQHPLLVDGVL